MRIVLRIFIILILLLSGGALFLGVKLYQQRDVLKGRTQKLEQTVKNVAAQLTAPKEPYIDAIQQKIDDNALMSYPDMDAQLKVLETIAVNRYEDLFNTKDELKKTRDELTKTQQELAQTKQALDAANAEIVNLKDQLTRKEAELAAANQKISDLEGQIAQLNQTIEGHKQQIVKLEDEKQELTDKNTQLEVELERALGLGRGGQPGVMKPGLVGKVLAVNPEWNFVILDVGVRDGARVGGEMLVHRGEELIGKIRIVDIRERMAVGDIKRDWQQQPIQEGDRVLY